MMKKNLILFITFLTISWLANAQTTLLNEGFESNSIPTGWITLDADGDGFNWTTNDPEIANLHPHTGSHCVISASYDNSMNGGPLFPDNWLITPSITLPATGFSELSFYVRSQAPSYPENFGIYISTTGTDTANFFSVYEGSTPSDYQKISINLGAYAEENIHIAFRHFNSTDNLCMNVDDIQVIHYTSPLIVAESTNLNFTHTVADLFSTQHVYIAAYNLTTDVTATVSGNASFSISTDDTTFASTATLPSTGGYLYVQYSPAAIGTHTGQITLSATGATNTTVQLSGNAINCSGHITLPYTQGFEAGMPECFTLIDEDYNNNGWKIFNQFPHSGQSMAASLSSAEIYHVNDVDNWMILPFYTVGDAHTVFSFWAAGINSDENFGVYISTEGTGISSFTSVLQRTAHSNFLKYSVSLDDYAGQTVSIAIRHYNVTDNANALRIDDIEISENNTPSIEIIENAHDFGEVRLNSEHVYETNIAGHLLTSGITATTSAPFSVSNDGITFANTTTLPTDGGLLYIKFNPTTENTFTDSVVLSATGVANSTITLTGSAVDCSHPITTYPFTESFENGIPTCWTVIDANNDGVTWTWADGGGHTSEYYVQSVSLEMPTTDEWLITPALVITEAPVLLSFYLQSVFVPDHYGVYISTSGTEISDFDSIYYAEAPLNAFQPVKIRLDDYVGDTVHIAFRHFNSDAFIFMIDDISVQIFDQPTIDVTEEIIDFGTVIAGQTKTYAIEVDAYAMTDSITITTTEPFCASSDGNNYGSTATLPLTGGTLNIRYAPTEAGTHSGIVTLSSPGAEDVTVNLTGSSYECDVITDFPYTESFDDDELPECWIAVDADGDGFNWDFDNLYASEHTHSGEGMMSSASYINGYGPLTPDNWLITPQIEINENSTMLSFWIAGQSNIDFLEKYGVYVSTTGVELEDFTQISEGITTNEWAQINVDLSNYTNQNIYVAFRHFDCTDQFWIKLDDVRFDRADVGINNHAESLVTVYPNPAHNILNVNSNENIESIIIYDMAGAQVGFYNGSSTNTQINVTNLSNGMYFLKIKTPKGMITKKVNIIK